MTIKKYKTKKGVRYGYEIQFNHQRYSKSGFSTKREAIEEELKEERRLKQSLNDLDFRIMVIERTKHIEQNCTAKYVRENKYMIGRLLSFFKDKTLVSEISKEEVERFLSNHYPTKYGYNYAFAQLRAMFRFAVDKGWTTHNPCERIKRRSTDKRMKYVPPKEDLDRVINVTDTFEEMAFFLVLKHTLARSIEIYNLKWEDVDLDNRQITLWTRKKRGGERTPRHLTINDQLFVTLSLIEKKHDNVFWCKKTGKPYEDRKKLLIGACKAAGVKRFTLHSFRHFGASQLAMKGVSLPEIQTILGHENVLTTSRYIQSLGVNKTEAINLLE